MILQIFEYPEFFCHFIFAFFNILAFLKADNLSQKAISLFSIDRMVMLYFRCSCGQGFLLPENWAGRETICPKCQTKISVPAQQPNATEISQPQENAKAPAQANAQLPGPPSAGIQASSIQPNLPGSQENAKAPAQASVQPHLPEPQENAKASAGIQASVQASTQPHLPSTQENAKAPAGIQASVQASVQPHLPEPQENAKAPAGIQASVQASVQPHLPSVGIQASVQASTQPHLPGPQENAKAPVQASVQRSLPAIKAKPKTSAVLIKKETTAKPTSFKVIGPKYKQSWAQPLREALREMRKEISQALQPFKQMIREFAGKVKAILAWIFSPLIRQIKAVILIVGLALFKIFRFAFQKIKASFRLVFRYVWQGIRLVGKILWLCLKMIWKIVTWPCIQLIRLIRYCYIWILPYGKWLWQQLQWCTQLLWQGLKICFKTLIQPFIWAIQGIRWCVIQLYKCLFWVIRKVVLFFVALGKMLWQGLCWIGKILWWCLKLVWKIVTWPLIQLSRILYRCYRYIIAFMQWLSQRIQEGAEFCWRFLCRVCRMFLNALYWIFWLITWPIVKVYEGIVWLFLKLYKGYLHIIAFIQWLSQRIQEGVEFCWRFLCRVCRMFLNALYWIFWLITWPIVKVYQGLAWTFAKVYQGIAWIFTKVYQGIAWIFTKVYQGLAWIFAKVYQGIAWIFTKVYQGLAWIFTKVYQGLAWIFAQLYQGIIWVCRLLLLPFLFIAQCLRWIVTRVLQVLGLICQRLAIILWLLLIWPFRQIYLLLASIGKILAGFLSYLGNLLQQIGEEVLLVIQIFLFFSPTWGGAIAFFAIGGFIGATLLGLGVAWCFLFIWFIRKKKKNAAKNKSASGQLHP